MMCGRVERAHVVFWRRMYAGISYGSKWRTIEMIARGLLMCIGTAIE